DDSAIVRPLDAPDIRRQVRFDPLPLLIAQPKQVVAHDPNPLPKTNQDRIVRAEKLMSSDPSRACTHKRGHWPNVRFWGEADMARRPLAYRPVADDPKRTKAAQFCCDAQPSSLIVRDFKEVGRMPMANGSARFRTIQICPKDLVRDWRHSDHKC